LFLNQERLPRDEYEERAGQVSLEEVVAQFPPEEDSKPKPRISSGWGHNLEVFRIGQSDVDIRERELAHERGPPPVPPGQVEPGIIVGIGDEVHRASLRIYQPEPRFKKSRFPITIRRWATLTCRVVMEIHLTGLRKR